MRGKHRYGCAPIWRFCTVSSRQICPSNGRLLVILPKATALCTYPYILQEGSDHFTEVSCKMESSSTAEPGIQRRAIRYVHTSCAIKTRHHQNEGIQSIQVPRRKPRINTFNMFDLDSMKSLLHCWFEVSVQQRDNRRGVSSGQPNGTNKKPTCQYRTHLME
jgi:hypothetical protein